MRSYLPAFELKSPGSLREVLGILGTEPGVWRPFAGGTDLMVLLEAGNLAHRKYVDIWRLNELRGIEVASDQVTLGSLTTYSEIQRSAILREEFPMLCQAASETGGLAIQNRGTLGGNIANASPAADAPPALLAYDAELELISNRGSRRIAYPDFHRGYKQMDLEPDELIARIFLPRSRFPLHHYYRKVGTRKAQAISKVCFAAVGRIENQHLKEVRIGLGSVAPVPLRCSRTEKVLRGRPVDQLAIVEGKAELSREIKPIDDIRSTSKYRLQVSLNLMEDFLISLTHL